jgi:sortase A
MAVGKSAFEILKENYTSFIGQFTLWFAGLVALFAAFGFIPESLIGSIPGEQWAKDRYSDVISWVTGVSDAPADRPTAPPGRIDDSVAGILTNVPRAELAAGAIARIRAPKVGIDVTVNHPTSVDVASLDESLKNGAVYYPGSGTPASGNVFIFGHSTNWAVVRNEAYRAFNGLEKLVAGDEIILETAEYDFVYRVDSVELVDADSALVYFDSTTPKLTVSTCNTFGEKQERHVAEATLVEARPKR